MNEILPYSVSPERYLDIFKGQGEGDGRLIDKCVFTTMCLYVLKVLVIDERALAHIFHKEISWTSVSNRL